MKMQRCKKAEGEEGGRQAEGKPSSISDHLELDTPYQKGTVSQNALSCSCRAPGCLLLCPYRCHPHAYFQVQESYLAHHGQSRGKEFPHNHNHYTFVSTTINQLNISVLSKKSQPHSQSAYTTLHPPDLRQSCAVSPKQSTCADTIYARLSCVCTANGLARSGVCTATVCAFPYNEAATTARRSECNSDLNQSLIGGRKLMMRQC